MNKSPVVTNTVMVSGSFAAMVLVAASVIAGLAGFTIGSLNPKAPVQPVGEVNAYFVQATAQNGLYGLLPPFFKAKAMTDDDIRHFGKALRIAERCPTCTTMWEAHGSSDYYTVPLVAKIGTGEFASASYSIVVGEIQHVNGSAVEDYAPHFVVYEYYRMGGARRVDEVGNVALLAGERWVPDLQSAGDEIKARAFKVLDARI